jgi:hypothetical protein
LDFAHNFCHACNTHGYGLLFYNVLVYVFETLGYLMNYVKKTKDPLNERNVILIYYVVDFSKSQNYNLKFFF